MVNLELRNLLNNVLLTRNIIIEDADSNKTLVRYHIFPKSFKKKKNKHVYHLPKYKKIPDNFIDEECSICCDNFKKSEFYRELPICKHIFHKKCIDKWFYKDAMMRCPLCRTSHTNNNC